MGYVKRHLDARCSERLIQNTSIRGLRKLFVCTRLFIGAIESLPTLIVQ